MTDDRVLKQAVRRRMEETGEKYTEARRAVLGGSAHEEAANLKDSLSAALSRTRQVAWAPWDDPPGLEDLMLTFRDDGMRVSSVILRAGRGSVRFRYLAELDLQWRLRRIRFESVGDKVNSGWGLSVDEDGTWRNDSGEELKHLAGRLGVDMTATPMTKTLLVRRLDLAVGESAEVDVVHIMVPGLRLERRHQRYTRLGERDYRIEGPDSTVSYHDDRPVEDVVHRFQLDHDGLVLDWPGRFRRVWTVDQEAQASEARQIIDRQAKKKKRTDPNRTSLD